MNRPPPHSNATVVAGTVDVDHTSAGRSRDDRRGGTPGPDRERAVRRPAGSRTPIRRTRTSVVEWRWAAWFGPGPRPCGPLQGLGQVRPRNPLAPVMTASLWVTSDRSVPRAARRSKATSGESHIRAVIHIRGYRPGRRCQSRSIPVDVLALLAHRQLLWVRDGTQTPAAQRFERSPPPGAASTLAAAPFPVQRPTMWATAVSGSSGSRRSG